MWKAAVQGAPIRTIAEFTASTTALAAATEFEACGELDGKRLGVASTRGLSPALFDMYIEHDCPGTHPEILVVLESAGRAAALLSGEIDAVILPGEELIKLQREAPGKFHSLMFYGEVFRDVRIDSLHVARPWAERNPETVKDFLRALLRAQRRVAADPQLLYDEAVQRLELDPATAEAIGRSHLGMNIWDPNGGLTAENLQGTLDLLIAVEALPAGTEVREVADLSYLNGVLDEIGRK
jgi:ABC-type nitrate/sulfonate/bicarbonate transport system substrate-binding protein